MARNILVVEDDHNISDLIRMYLEKEGFEVRIAYDGGKAVEEYDAKAPDMVLLDIMLPVMDGWAVCAKIRETSKVPIIMLTAKAEIDDRITGLDAGADDYLTKPFSVEELLARLRATQRRLSILQNASLSEASSFTNGDLHIDYAAGCAYLKDEELHLTPIEYKLLCLLSRNMGKVLTHKYITQAIWGTCWESDVASLRVFMATLRRKIEPKGSSTRYIQTHIGVGYRMLKVDEES